MTAVPDEPDQPRPGNEMQGMPGQDQAQLREREARAMRLRRLGGSYSQIAREMGYADGSGIRQLILRALDRIVADSATHLRALENERLDAITTTLLTIVGDTRATPQDRIRAADAYTRASARRARMNGLDAPVQVAVSAGSLAELDDALALLEDVVLGEVTESHELGPEQPAPDAAAGPEPGEAAGSSSDD